MSLITQTFRPADERAASSWRVAPLCRPLVQQIEELLEQRRSNRERWGGPKTWTQSEFCRLAYSSYKCLRAGSVRYPPRREVMLQIADYLECSFDQRNTLLLAAGYVPEPGPSGDIMLDWALAVARGSIAELPMPAFVLTDDWRIAAANSQLARSFGPAVAEAWAQERDYLRLLFDPALPVRAWLSQLPGTWETLAGSVIDRFRRAQHDPAALEAQQRMQLLLDLPDFAAYWQRPADQRAGEEQPLSIKLRMANGTPIQVYVAEVRVCSQRYPHVLALMPADVCSQQRMIEGSRMEAPGS
jgi:hypothetical protein